MVVVRFLVGQPEEEAIVRLNQKMFANFDLIPPGCSQPLIKPRSIDDVPILDLTFHGGSMDHYTLRRIVAEAGLGLGEGYADLLSRILGPETKPEPEMAPLSLG